MTAALINAKGPEKTETNNKLTNFFISPLPFFLNIEFPNLYLFVDTSSFIDKRAEQIRQACHYSDKLFILY